MSFYNKTNIIIAKVQNKKRSSIEINQSILTKLKVNDTTSKVKKLSSLNDERADTVKNIFNEQMEILRLQKAKRALLYLINIKSNGTFCPKIVDYFKDEATKNSIKKNEINQIQEENFDKLINLKTKNDAINSNIDNLILKNSLLSNVNEKNDFNYNKNIKKEKTIIINGENKIITNDITKNNYDIKDIENIIDNEELNIINNNENKLEPVKEFQENMNIHEESTVNKKDMGGGFNNKKKRKKSNIKNKTGNLIDLLYKLQRSELQKSGNYHSSLRTTIQNNLLKKTFKNKKK